MRFLIVGGGSIDNEFALEYIEKSKFDKYIAADRGLEFFSETNLKPDIIVGDFDSVSENVLQSFLEVSDIEICRLNPEKDDTDLEHAVRLAIEKGATDIEILGATGSRIDHVLGNIQLLGIATLEAVPIKLINANYRIQVLGSNYSIKKEEHYGKYVSIVPIGRDETKVSLRGFKYEITDFVLEYFNTLGISNEIVDENAYIELKNGKIILIESKE